jgi:hypothetical protein
MRGITYTILTLAAVILLLAGIRQSDGTFNFKQTNIVLFGITLSVFLMAYVDGIAGC